MTPVRLRSVKRAMLCYRDERRRGAPLSESDSVSTLSSLSRASDGWTGQLTASTEYAPSLSARSTDSSLGSTDSLPSPTSNTASAAAAARSGSLRLSLEKSPVDPSTANAASTPPMRDAPDAAPAAVEKKPRRRKKVTKRSRARPSDQSCMRHKTIDFWPQTSLSVSDSAESRLSREVDLREATRVRPDVKPRIVEEDGKQPVSYQGPPHVPVVDAQ